MVARDSHAVAFVPFAAAVTPQTATGEENVAVTRARSLADRYGRIRAIGTGRRTVLTKCSRAAELAQGCMTRCIRLPLKIRIFFGCAARFSCGVLSRIFHELCIDGRFKIDPEVVAKFYEIDSNVSHLIR